MAKRTAFKKLELIKNWKIYILALPAIILFLLFAYLPMPGVILAFKKYTIQGGIFGSEFVGFANFALFFASSDIFRLLRNIFVINFSGLIITTVFTIFCAIAINQLFSSKIQKIYQNLLFLPYFFSVIIMVKFAMMFFDDSSGLINQVLQSAGFKAVEFSKTGWVWVPIVVGTSLIKGLGYGIIVYLATITGMDSEIYEAARIDGAGRMVQIFKITLPLLKPTIILLLLMSIGKMFFGDFVFLSAFAGDNYIIKEHLDIIETFIFRNITTSSASSTPDYGMTSAVGLFQSALGFVMILASNMIVRKIDKNLALF